MRLPSRFFSLALLSLAYPATAEPAGLQPVPVTEWKAVYAEVTPRDRMPARARLGGTLVELSVIEGDLVTSGQAIGRIVDEKLEFQMTALDAQQGALQAQMTNAKSELARGESLLKQGVATEQGLDALRTRVQVLEGQLAALAAQADVLAQQIKDGTVLAPAAGRVLDVPVSKGAVVMPGEAVATIAGGGTFLRLQVPERHAGALHQGDTIQISEGDATRSGRLSRVYPLIQNGRVTADVDLAGLSDAFVDARILVRLPVGQREALMVPAAALHARAGLDFVTVQGSAGPVSRAVVPGDTQVIDGAEMVEILSGLQPGDVLVEATHD
ncbi:efflux RND transporter periplasmic adaptor subunit [Rhodobacter sp. KR11]|jgi:RND family efflux transporter MFP subunit|uniref:efflux RND transporter periplasmic adaptor subunit n=1 Tax=Rhodobacter sp. KR11 TaxID=2974588 RepID=UPI002223E8AF|nr:efflux RND transporter periplasmic adaptor subunit [Rhodobacter sp. KR11]MCW1919765.1 efflux RND transporter periplasmic adaptor subunit [Rhodobacter sp. KR11]